MTWIVEFHPAFEKEFLDFPQSVQDSIAARALLLKEFGHQLSRPHADTLVASKHTNLKELRCDADDGAWRIAFAFDPKRKAVLLVAGDKSGVSQKRFYKKLIAIADKRFDEHLAHMKG